MRRTTRFLLAAVVITGVLALGAPAGASVDADEWQHVCRINAARVAHGRAPVQVTPGLRTIARDWSGFMAAVGRLDHNPRLVEQITGGVTSSWDGIAENVAYGDGPNQTHAAFMGSPGHRANILDPAWEYVGVFEGGRHWVTEDFLSTRANLQALTDPHHPFVDVCTGHPFLAEIRWMDQQGISRGYADGSYRGGEVVTRQSMSAFMHRLADAPAGPFPNPGFSDVSTSTPFHQEIWWMAQRGITSGYPDGTFRPGSRVSREAMSAFMHRYAEAATSGFPNPGFRDVPPSHAFFTEIAWAAHEDITQGYADGTFRPGSAVTRQAMSAFMRRLADV